MKWHKRSHDEIMQDMGEFLREFQAESDRGSALLGATVLDERLGEIILAFMRDVEASNRLLAGFNAPLQSLWARTEAALALSLITADEYENLNLIRKIRNEFAHQTHGLTFDSEHIENLCQGLTAGFVVKRKGATRNAGRQEALEVFGGTARKLFEQAVITILTHLMYRAHFVEKEKRQPASWSTGLER